MRVVVPKETGEGEHRVALVPESVGRLTKAGLEVVVERGAGAGAGFADSAFEKAGAHLDDLQSALSGADIVVRVQPPTLEEVASLPARVVLIGLLRPLNSPKLLQALAAHNVTAFAMEMVPRITRAQRMDVLSSQATVAGYKAVLIAASTSGKFFPMLMTAAGTIPPAKVLVLGAGVAGLQAIATARRLGAVVQGFDIRPAVKEQVESLGATWVGIEMAEAEDEGGYAQEVSEEHQRQEREHLHKLVSDADVVITTAQIPGRPPPVLITTEAVKDMRAGSVIVDLAGGNCELTEAGHDVVREGVHILSPPDLAATLPLHASQMYSRNVTALLNHLVPETELNIDLEDEITSGCLVTHEGEVVHGRVKAVVAAAGE